MQGSVIIRQKKAKACPGGPAAERAAAATPVLHVDIIRDTFWQTHPHVLA